MKWSSLAESREVRVDQSHCNFYLASALQEAGWDLLFRDAGRHSRGGRGTQGESLRVFESGGLHIPDLVAAKSHDLLIVEIDSSWERARPSLDTYRLHVDDLRVQFGQVIGRELGGSLCGYCQTGIVEDVERLEQKIRRGSGWPELVVGFVAARQPVLRWVTSGLA